MQFTMEELEVRKRQDMSRFQRMIGHSYEMFRTDGFASGGQGHVAEALLDVVPNCSPDPDLPWCELKTTSDNASKMTFFAANPETPNFKHFLKTKNADRYNRKVKIGIKTVGDDRVFYDKEYPNHFWSVDKTILPKMKHKMQTLFVLHCRAISNNQVKFTKGVLFDDLQSDKVVSMVMDGTIWLEYCLGSKNHGIHIRIKPDNIKHLYTKVKIVKGKRTSKKFVSDTYKERLNGGLVMSGKIVGVSEQHKIVQAVIDAGPNGISFKEIEKKFDYNLTTVKLLNMCLKLYKEFPGVNFMEVISNNIKRAGGGVTAGLKVGKKGNVNVSNRHIPEKLNVKPGEKVEEVVIAKGKRRGFTVYLEG